MSNPQLTNYIIPTALDTPEMEVVLVDNPYRLGPFGAKGVGEIPMDVPAPAVAAAIHQATGKIVPNLPILPETLLHLLRSKDTQDAEGVRGAASRNEARHLGVPHNSGRVRQRSGTPRKGTNS
jgi:hypothetical protein